MNNKKKLKLFFSLTWNISPSYILLLCFYTIIGSGQILVNVILPKFLIDELMGSRQSSMLFLWGSLIIASNLIFAWLNQWLKKKMDIKNQFLNQKMEQALGNKIMNVAYHYLEDPYYLDLKERALFAAVNQSAMLNLIIKISDLLKNLVTLFGLVTIMITLSPIFVFLLLCIIGLMLFIQQKFIKYQVKFYQDIIPTNRKYNYYVSLSFNDTLQKDIRLYGMAPMLGDRVTYYNCEITNWLQKFYKKQGFYMGLYSMMNDLQAALAYGYVGLRVMTNWFGSRIGLGSFTMYVNSAINFSKAVIDFGKDIMSVQQMLNYLEPFMELMSLPEEQEAKDKIPFQGEVESICFDHITFTYPNTDTPILNDISFEIKKGEKISIVGLNGAGKTTLIKLLCRLYQPTKGKILINGRDIFEYEVSSYNSQIAAVFQDYKLFNFSIEENITCESLDTYKESDISKELDTYKKLDTYKELSTYKEQRIDKRESRETKAEKIIKQVGLKEKIESLPNGIKSLFGKAYSEDGIELSGGQSQKVAIARALYKNASLIILDEPTSALDPLAEAEIYENFNQLVGKKTAIYISHRMSSSIFCDKILVLDKGSISDFASHSKLMEKKESLYYQLFHSQAVNYQIQE